MPSTVVIEGGYRNQTTVGPETQTLSTVPNVVVRYGFRSNNEVLASLPTYSSRTGEEAASELPAASGQQDLGVGFKHMLYDGAAVQDAINLFVTFPTGYPTSAAGFSADLPTYDLGYSIAFSPSSRVGLSTTQDFVLNAEPDASGTGQRFFTYQPAISASYALSPNLSLLLQNQWSFSSGIGAGTEDRALAGLQFTVLANVVLDGEFEVNLLPPPGRTQHAVGVGITVQP